MSKNARLTKVGLAAAGVVAGAVLAGMRQPVGADAPLEGGRDISPSMTTTP